MRQDLAQHCKVVAAVDEFEALIVFPVVELVRVWDLEDGEKRGLAGDAGEGEGCVPGVWWREVDGEGEDAVAGAVSSISRFRVRLLGENGDTQAIISQPCLWRNFASQLPASEHSHDFLFGIFTQHRFRESKYPRIVDRGCISDLLVSPKVCLAAPCQDDGVRSFVVGCDAVRCLVDDAVAIGSRRLEPPSVRDVR